MTIILGILLIVLMVCMVILTICIAGYFVTETSINIKQSKYYEEREEKIEY